MTDTVADTPAPVAALKGKKGKAASPAAKKAAKTKAPTHPPIAQMVPAAIASLKERGGSSTQAIKKYISSTYKIDAEKKSKFICKYLNSAVAEGSLVRTKGKGASGSFKLAAAGDKASSQKAAKPKASAKKVKTSPKKATAVSKAKKTKKPPTATKSPKPKVGKAKPAAKPKRAAPKKPVAASPKKAVARKPPTKRTSPKK